ncbi:MAG: FHA domain-containing protein, partial [Cyanobacteria bacterium P01_G01_bin.49]
MTYHFVFKCPLFLIMLHPAENSPNTQHILAFNSGNDQRIFHLDQSQYSIGRHPNNAIVINAEGISRQHATLCKKTQTAGIFSFIIIDGNLQGNKSKNGILINGYKRHKHELKHGDIIQFNKEVKAQYYIVNQNNDYFVENFSPNISSKSTPIKTQQPIKETQIIDRSSLDLSSTSNLRNLASVVELSPI